MEPLAYCRDVLSRFAPEQLLAIDLLPAHRRPRALAAEAIIQSLRDVTEPGRERDVARVKLAWWRDELDRMIHGTPRHPLGQAGQQVELPAYLDDRGADELVRVGEVELDPPSLPDISAWRKAASGEGALLAAEVQATETSSVDSLAEVGELRRVARWLSLARANATAGRMLLPLDAVARFDLTPARVAVDGLPEACIDLLTLPCSARPDVVGVRALVALHLERGRMTDRQSAGPWNRLWRVWRATRAAKSA